MDNSFVQSERERRLKMWEEIQLITREHFLKSEEIKRIGYYNHGKGVWRDAKKTIRQAKVILLIQVNWQ